MDRELINIFMTGLLSFLITFLVTKKLIPVLKRKSFGQNIRTEGPQSHLSKSGTPSMGGIAIIAGTVVATIIGGISGMDIESAIVCSAAFVLFGLIGAIDDYLNIARGKNEGLTPKQKLFLQLIFALGFAVYFACFRGVSTAMYIPFIKVNLDLGILYIPFVVFTILAMTNGVNLTDGLDGLASSVTLIFSLCMLIFIRGFGVIGTELFFIALAGACVGFLCFNKKPARIFMGDTGSLAIGGGITVAAFTVNMELLLPLIGIIFVCETISVIIQVSYFKITKGKRLFRMTPIHHHFELGGMSESNVVYMFGTITLVAGIFVLFLA